MTSYWAVIHVLMAWVLLRPLCSKMPIFCKPVFGNALHLSKGSVYENLKLAGKDKGANMCCLVDTIVPCGPCVFCFFFSFFFCRGQWIMICFILIHSATIRPQKMKIMSFWNVLICIYNLIMWQMNIKVNKLFNYMYTKCLDYLKDTLIC